MKSVVSDPMKKKKRLVDGMQKKRVNCKQEVKDPHQKKKKTPVFKGENR